MEKEFIPYELAITLNEIGFDEPCFGYYLTDLRTTEVKLFIDDRKGFSSFEKTTPAPIFSQAFRWFREKYNLRGFIGFRPNVKQFDCHIYDMSLSGKEYTEQRTMEEFNRDPKVGTHEEAELECLKKLIEIVKEK
jgi:hypothetical protein